MVTGGPVRRALRPRRAWGVLAALGGLGLLCLGVRGLDLGALAASLAQVHGGWLAAAAALQGLSLLFGGLAWRVGLTAGVARLPVRHVVAAHWIGQAANILLPARLGEVARVMAVRRHVSGGAPAAQIAGSLAAQRLLGGVSSFVVVVTVILVLPLPGLLGTFRPWAGGALGLAVLSALVLPRLGLGRHAAGKVPERLRGVVAQVVNGAQVLRAGRARAVSLVIHMGELGAQLGSIIALLRAFRVQVPMSAALLVFCLLAMASVLPSLPGGLGINQAAVVAPLGSLYGVGAPVALAFSLGMQATGVGVALLGGLVGVCHQRLGRPHTCRTALGPKGPAGGTRRTVRELLTGRGQLQVKAQLVISRTRVAGACVTVALLGALAAVVPGEAGAQSFAVRPSLAELRPEGRMVMPQSIVGSDADGGRMTVCFLTGRLSGLCGARVFYDGSSGQTVCRFSIRVTVVGTKLAWRTTTPRIFTS